MHVVPHLKEARLASNATLPFVLKALSAQFKRQHGDAGAKLRDSQFVRAASHHISAYFRRLSSLGRRDVPTNTSTLLSKNHGITAPHHRTAQSHRQGPSRPPRFSRPGALCLRYLHTEHHQHHHCLPNSVLAARPALCKEPIAEETATTASSQHQAD
ncbi:hypothetical protein L1887_48083 [Cichorium endivia]|nr:hypothetical protein L1887_48083 [Cichorium endivia]